MSDVLTDAYPFCHFYFKEKGECEAVELFETAEFTFQEGHCLKPQTFKKLVLMAGN